ncbi:MAG: tRNA (adenosine(37)-N6)-threonylcarbamoyltransferase complex dimerization subunit type 1 TsaB [Pseudonocardiales bacterium]|nr:MAG: tRNA (adenosine(37)-N6)-threonylcarbamoyltransferase complex dimerization subunit type 1 TsaB [Pseudonocardiales bacterium]
MLVLAIDTSTPAVTAAVGEVGDGGAPALLAQRVTVDARRHGELLTPSIEAVLSESGCAPGDLAAVVAGVGPGPFTGLRIGLVSAAALADALGLPTYGVCSLDAIAHAPAGMTARMPGGLLVATDARRREIYWAVYGPDGARLVDPSVSRPADVPVDGCVLARGAGAQLYADVLGLPVEEPAHPPALALITLAAGRVSAGAPSEVLTPLYLRRPDATEPALAKPALGPR